MNRAIVQRDETITLPDLSALTMDQLEAEFSVALKDTADGLLRLAAATTELERRGRDLSHLKLNLISYLRLIAARQLLPDVVLYLGDQKNKVLAIANLPLAQQRKLLEADEIHVLVDGEDSTVPLRELDSRHLKQVFGERRIRSIAEQLAFVREKRTGRAAKEERPRKVQPVHQRGGIKIGNSFGTVAEVVSALSDLAGPLADLDIEAAETDTMTFRATAEEKAKVKAAAKRVGLTTEYLVRKALHAYGLI